MKKRALVIMALLAAFAATATSFATTSATTTASVSAGSGFSVTEAGTSGKHGQAPSWTVIEGTADSIDTSERGDLYVVDLSAFPGDVVATLYLTNPADLAAAYSYLNMAITAYEKPDTTWSTEPVLGKDDGTFTTYLTLSNGFIALPLVGGKAYSIGIDAGSYYVNDAANTLTPSFFIDVR
ncbi:MAG: hypothetical protein WD535_00880 [Thermaerobacterales bacterium]